MQLVEFSINDAASPLGSGYTPFYADRCQHPRRPFTSPAQPNPAIPVGDGEAAAHLMGRMMAEVRTLLQERQDQRKAELTLTGGTCCSQWGTRLLNTKHTPLPSL